MKASTLLVLGGLTVGGIVLLAGSAGAAPTGPGGTPLPKNLTVVRSKFGLVSAGSLVKAAQDGSPVVIASFDPTNESIVLAAMSAAAAEAPGILFAAAPIALIYDNIPDDFRAYVPEGLRWGVGAVANMQPAYQRLSTNDATQEEVDAAVAAAVAAVQGMAVDGATDTEGADPLSAWLIWQLGEAGPIVEPPKPPGPPKPPVPPPNPPDGSNGGGVIVPADPADPGPPIPPPSPPGPSGPGSGGGPKGISGGAAAATERRFRYVFQNWQWSVIVRRRADKRWDWWIQPPTSNMAVLTGIESTQARAEAKAIERIKKWDSPSSWDTVIGDDLRLHVRRYTNTVWGWWVTSEGFATPLRKGEESSEEEAREAAQVAAYQLATAGHS